MATVITLAIIFIVIIRYSFEEVSYNEKHKCNKIEFREKLKTKI